MVNFMLIASIMDWSFLFQYSVINLFITAWIYLLWPMIYLLVLDNLSILQLLWITLNFKTSNTKLFTFEKTLCIGIR